MIDRGPETSLPVLYTQTGCVDSERVHDWLAQRGISVTERNVTGDLAAAEALAATGIFATPLLVIGDRTVFGYRPAQLAVALGLPQE